MDDVVVDVADVVVVASAGVVPLESSDGALVGSAADVTGVEAPVVGAEASSPPLLHAASAHTTISTGVARTGERYPPWTLLWVHGVPRFALAVP